MSSFGILERNILTSLIALQFYLAAHNWRKEVFGVTSNVSIDRQINLLELGCFTGTDYSYDIGLLSINTPGLDTMVD